MTATAERTLKPLSDEEKGRISRGVTSMSEEQRVRLLRSLQPRLVPEYYMHTPHPKQQVFLSLKVREAMFGGAAGGGKSDALLMAALQYALAMDTPIPTPDGWSTIEDLEIGDQVIGADGLPTTVMHKSPVFTRGERYRLTFDDGEQITADGDHLWLAETFSDRMGASRNPDAPDRLVTTREMFRTQLTNHKKSVSNWSVRLTKPVELPEKDLPIDPYLLGAWLGDGSKRDGTMAGDDSDHEVYAAFRDAGYTVTEHKDGKWHVSGLRTQLEVLGVRNDKRVPVEYLRGSKEQRLALLQGLMDTDGTVDSRWGIPRFANTNEDLIEAVMEIAASLGWKPRRFKDSYTTPVSKYERAIHVVTFIADVPVFRMARKAERQVVGRERPQARAQLHRVVRSIERLEDGAMNVQCITVDNESHTYLAGKGMIPTHNCDVPGYSALLLRRKWPDLNSPGAILDRTRQWLINTNATIREGGRRWIFPSGARITFGTLLNENDKYNYQSAEYQFVGWDELTHFPRESDYEYLFSRIRRPQLICLNCNTRVRKLPKGGVDGWTHVSAESQQTCIGPFPDPQVLRQYPAAQDGTTIFDVPLRMRSATNPGGLGHEWVYNRFINPATRKKGAVFIPSFLSDNPSLDREAYMESLGELGEVEKERLLNGDWNITEQGDMFERHWFKTIRQAPVAQRSVRSWDSAATAGGGDWTVGAKVSLVGGRWVIEDVVRGQWSSAQKQEVIRQVAASDGRDVHIVMEQEGGSAGVDVIDHYRREVLPGYVFHAEKPSGDKSTRALPLSSAAEAGNVYLVEGRWNSTFLDEATQFPAGQHDDQVDAVSQGLNYIAEKMGRGTRLLV